MSGEEMVEPIEERILGRTSLEDIVVKISYYPWVAGKDVEVSIPSMEYDGHKIILDSVILPSITKIPSDEDFNASFKNPDGSYKTALVSVSYVYGKDKTPVFKTDTISIAYTDNPETVLASKNAVVEQSIVLSNTGKIFSQLETLCNSGNYILALDLINAQIQALQKIQENSKDREIEVEIQNLKKAESLIHQKLVSDNAFSN